jgi:hypothetical protein
MPTIHGRHNGRQLFLQVAIIHPDDFRSYVGSPARFLRDYKAFDALVDTGATATMISPRVVAALNLLPVGRLPLATIGREVMWPWAHLFHVGFVVTQLTRPNYPTPPDDATKFYSVHVNKAVIRGGEMPDETGFDVLLGMDIITTGRLEVAPGGDFSFTFNESWLITPHDGA